MSEANSAFSSTSRLNGADERVVRIPVKPRQAALSRVNMEPLWQGAVHDRLEKLVRLKKGWDGYSGQPISISMAFFTVDVLRQICKVTDPAPSIIPGGSGDLQLEWHTNRGDLEIHIIAANEVVACRALASGEVDEEPLTNDFNLAAQWVRQILEPSIDSAPGTAAA